MHMSTSHFAQHERRDGLTERRAMERVSLRYIVLRSVIAPSVWPYRYCRNHLNYESLGFSQIVTRVTARRPVCKHFRKLVCSCMGMGYDHQYTEQLTNIL